MSVNTEFQEKRDLLRSKLDECVKLAGELMVDSDIWGADEYSDSYKEKIYFAVKNARNKI